MKATARALRTSDQSEAAESKSQEEPSHIAVELLVAMGALHKILLALLLVCAVATVRAAAGICPSLSLRDVCASFLKILDSEKYGGVVLTGE